MIERATMQRVIEAGNLAPSGSNSQPWRFEVDGNVIKIFIIPERDHAVLNFKNRGTYVAFGALLENMEIAAHQLGLNTNTHLSLHSNSAEMSLKTGEKLDNLYDEIHKRHTSRRHFKKIPVSEHDKKYLMEECGRFPSCELVFAEELNLHPAAKALALDIKITLQNQLLHRLLFEEILWKEEHQMTRKGLYVKTMEVKPPKSSVFKIMRHWKAAKFFSKLKIPQKIYEENVATISSGGIIGAIAVEDSDNDFIEAGRLMETIWLRAAKLGLRFQLITGILFLWQQANLGDGSLFSQSERERIDLAYDSLRDILKPRNGIFAVAFRIGHGDVPSAVSYKRPPEIIWK